MFSLLVNSTSSTPSLIYSVYQTYASSCLKCLFQRRTQLQESSFTQGPTFFSSNILPSKNISEKIPEVYSLQFKLCTILRIVMTACTGQFVLLRIQTPYILPICYSLSSFLGYKIDCLGMAMLCSDNIHLIMDLYNEGTDACHFTTIY